MWNKLNMNFLCKHFLIYKNLHGGGAPIKFANAWFTLSR